MTSVLTPDVLRALDMIDNDRTSAERTIPAILRFALIKADHDLVGSLLDAGIAFAPRADSHLEDFLSSCGADSPLPQRIVDQLGSTLTEVSERDVHSKFSERVTAALLFHPSVELQDPGTPGLLQHGYAALNASALTTEQAKRVAAFPGQRLTCGRVESVFSMMSRIGGPNPRKMVSACGADRSIEAGISLAELIESIKDSCTVTDRLLSLLATNADVPEASDLWRQPMDDGRPRSHAFAIDEVRATPAGARSGRLNTGKKARNFPVHLAICDHVSKMRAGDRQELLQALHALGRQGIDLAESYEGVSLLGYAILLQDVELLALAAEVGVDMSFITNGKQTAPTKWSDDFAGAVASLRARHALSHKPVFKALPALR